MKKNSIKARKKYTTNQKIQAIKILEQYGYDEASRRLKIPIGTLSQWRSKSIKAENEGNKWPPDNVAQAPIENSKTIVKSGLKIQEQKSKKPPNKSNTAKRYTPSQKAEAIELASQIGATKASRQLRISRFSIDNWKRQERLAAQGKGDSPTSGPDPEDIKQKRDLEILNMWKKHPGIGPSQIKNQLRREGIKVSVHTIRIVMEDAGYRPPKIKKHEHNGRYNSLRPNHMWHLDCVHRYIGRATTFSLIIIDDCSRFVVGHGVDDAERADLVISSFLEAVKKHGKPEFVMNDRGSAFWSWKGVSRFTSLLEEMGVEQIVAKDKQLNGKVEVFNGNLHKEFFNVQKFYDVNEMKRRLFTHLHWYNYKRTHHALGGLLVPADRYHGRSEEVLSRIEAGVTPDKDDLFSLRDRVLELFKVTSTNGVPEIFLMGQKLLGINKISH